MGTWVSGVPWRWGHGCRGFPGVGDLGVGGLGFPGDGDLGVGGSLALETWVSGIGISLALGTLVSGFLWRWRPGCRDRGSLALQTWGLGVHWRWRPGCRGFPGVGDLRVGGSLALETWPCGPHTETASQTAHHASDPPTALSAPDVVRTCGDAMTSLQGPGARCVLWVSRRLFLMYRRAVNPPIFAVLSEDFQRY